MKNTPVPDFQVVPRTAESSADSAVSISLSATPEEFHVLHAVQWSYAGTVDATSAGLSVAIDGTDVLDLDFNSNHGDIQFEKPIYGAIGKSMVITLKAGGTSVVGKLNAQTS